MEYIFGTRKREGSVEEVLKTVGEQHTNYAGQVTIQREYTDSVITDTFIVVDHYLVKDDMSGLCYDWYTITNHYRYEDKYTPIAGAIADRMDQTDEGLMETYDLSSTNASDVADCRTALEELYEMMTE